MKADRHRCKTSNIKPHNTADKRVLFSASRVLLTMSLSGRDELSFIYYESFYNGTFFLLYVLLHTTQVRVYRLGDYFKETTVRYY